jgi:hypothetical protein
VLLLEHPDEAVVGGGNAPAGGEGLGALQVDVYDGDGDCLAALGLDGGHMAAVGDVSGADDRHPRGLAVLGHVALSWKLGRCPGVAPAVVKPLTKKVGSSCSAQGVHAGPCGRGGPRCRMNSAFADTSGAAART